MKKILVILLVLLLSVSAFAQGAKQVNNQIVVGATPEPHAALLNLVKDDLAAKGYDLVVKEFTDYVVPNESLESGQLDANFFQHIPYLQSFNRERGFHLAVAGAIHVEPLALYSNNLKNIKDLKDGSLIAIPNDPTNEGRALLLLQANDLIKLKDPDSLEATILDIVDNPKNLKFKELEAATLPRVLKDVDGAVINGNYALPANLKVSDALLVEGAKSPYVNVVAVKEGNENSAKILALVDALQSDKVRAYIKERYPNQEVVVAF